jgi:hypothetical protein
LIFFIYSYLFFSFRDDSSNSNNSRRDYDGSSSDDDDDGLLWVKVGEFHIFFYLI